MAVKRGLGKGLDALIPPAKKEKDLSGEKGAGHVKLEIGKIEPNRSQPRKKFDEDALEELADSIKQVGLLEPILVRTRESRFEIIAGERRWRAARKAGLKEVPVIIRDDLSEAEIVEIQLIENIQREDLNPIEEAKAYERLISEFHIKQEELALRISKSRAAVTNSMRLLKLSDEVQQMIIDGKISSGHARALVSVENEKAQIKLAQKITDESLSVRETEKAVKQLSTGSKPVKEKKKNAEIEAIYRELEEKCKRALGTKVSVLPKSTGKGGKIEIEYYSTDDLEKITDRLLGS